MTDVAPRSEVGTGFLDAEAERIARLCHRMAERFLAGGRLVAFGSSPQARSDVRHVAVEFVHPVIVGKRALPALGLAGEGGPLAPQLELAVEPHDIVMAFERDEAALTIARVRGAETVAFAPADAAWVFDPPTGDPYARQEIVETLYHLLWELVHVFLEHRAEAHDTGASSFLYPFLNAGAADVDTVVADVAASVRMKAAEIAALREQTLAEGREPLAAAAAALRERFAAGGRVLALGNGGSATDAMDLVADLQAPPDGGPPRPALDLTQDAAILTALANDIGPEAVFARQVIAHGRPQDALVAFSTSGGSDNVIAALAEARRRGLVTVAFVGYDGGRIAAEALADHMVVTRSQHIPRIQEAQATAYHVLCDLVREP